MDVQWAVAGVLQRHAGGACDGDIHRAPVAWSRDKHGVFFAAAPYNQVGTASRGFMGAVRIEEADFHRLRVDRAVKLQRDGLTGLQRVHEGDGLRVLGLAFHWNVSKNAEKAKLYIL